MLKALLGGLLLVSCALLVAASERDDSMTAGDRSQRISLELEADPEAIRGTLEHGDGRREGFWGGLELMAALERVTSSTQSNQESQ
jgi:hypothetical protein